MYAWLIIVLCHRARRSLHDAFSSRKNAIENIFYVFFFFRFNKNNNYKIEIGQSLLMYRVLLCSEGSMKKSKGFSALKLIFVHIKNIKTCLVFYTKRALTYISHIYNYKPQYTDRQFHRFIPKKKKKSSTLRYNNYN